MPAKTEPKQEVFAAPTRPKPGELIVPVEPRVVIPQAHPAVIVPSSTPVQPIGLRPSDLTIYKIQRGILFGESPARMECHWQIYLMPIQALIKIPGSPLGRRS